MSLSENLRGRMWDRVLGTPDGFGIDAATQAPNLCESARHLTPPTATIVVWPTFLPGYDPFEAIAE